MYSQSWINAKAKQLQQEIERKVNAATNNGQRALTKADIERIARSIRIS